MSDPRWREYKAACCVTLQSKASAADPQPEPPAKFLDRAEAARLAAAIKARAKPAARSGPRSEPRPKRKRKRKKKRTDRPRKLVRTVLASTQDSEAFGWQVAAEVHKRGLATVGRKGYICDGQKYNWTIFEMHLIMLGFIGILDFLHLLGYLYGAAQAVGGKGTERSWGLYERWLRWAWSGQVKELVAGLRAGCAELGEPPEGCTEDDPRQVAKRR